MTAAIQYCNQDGKEDFGDFVRDELEEGELEETVEPLEKYDKAVTREVFYPIRLGDLVNERYLVEHKLGSGGFSTVWMANDRENNQEVALKVMSAGDSGERETLLQDDILCNARDASRFITYLDTFLLLGDGGRRHPVQVYPLVGPCLDAYTVKKLSMNTRMSAAWQLLEALEDLHEAGIVHRDLNERNCMWGIKPLDHLPRSAKYEALGRPLKQKIPIDDLWKQGELVAPVDVPQGLRTEKFYLGDFGLAKKINDPLTPRGCPPMDYCSPDRLHRQAPSFACDMWSYMVLFAELYLGIQPFTPFYNGGIIGGFVMALGPLPEKWKGLYAYTDGCDSWYDQNQRPIPRWTLKSRIAKLRPDADPVEQRLVLSIMSRVFIYDPAKRLTASQLLRDPAFRAIMENYGC